MLLLCENVWGCRSKAGSRLGFGGALRMWSASGTKAATPLESWPSSWSGGESGPHLKSSSGSRGGRRWSSVCVARCIPPETK